MKTFVTIALAIFGFTTTVHADQEATITCTGTDINLSVKIPYMGEGSEYAQRLYTLKSIDSNDNESANTAYFLNVKEKVVGAKKDISISGKNEVGGVFSAKLSAWKNESSEIIRMTTIGKISYNHGPLKGKDEAISCVLE